MQKRELTMLLFLACVTGTPWPESSASEMQPSRQSANAVRSANSAGGGAISGDNDGDGDVDIHDFTVGYVCFSNSGPDVTILSTCQSFDADQDSDVDLADFARFQLNFTGSLAGVEVDAGTLVPIVQPQGSYFSGEPGAPGNNALHGTATQAGYAQVDLSYEWSVAQQPPGSGAVMVSDALQPQTAYTLLPQVPVGEYVFTLRVTNLITLESAEDSVTLEVIECRADGDCDDGVFCNGPEVCIDQACFPGTPPLCDDAISCTVDSCNSGTDICAHDPVDSVCSNGLFCDGVEVCNPLSDCIDGPDPCDPPLLCDEASDACVQCLTSADCDDGLHCTGVETCLAGACQPGTPPDCDDSVACTIDSCNEDADNCNHVADDAACNDGLFCTGMEVCQANSGCVDGPDPCNPPLLCDEASDACVQCLTAADCDDGQHCNGMETCTTGACQPGTPPDCDDSVACTIDSCNEDADNCDHVADDAACNDGLFCTGTEVCQVDSGCVDGPSPCTPPLLCDEATDSCVQCLTAADCDDGLHCNGMETCMAGACQPGTPPECDDGFACTADSCNEDADNCNHVPNDAACNDGLFCTGMEICQVDSGCVAGVDPCPGQFCDEINETCLSRVMSCAPAASFAEPGATVGLDIFAHVVPNLRAYQTSITITQTSGTGSLTVHCPDGVFIAVGRPDFVFAGFAAGLDFFPAVNCGLRRAAASLLSANVTVGTTPAYLSSYGLTISADAAPGSTFEISIDPASSFLVNPSGGIIPFTIAEPCVLTVGSPGP